MVKKTLLILCALCSAAWVDAQGLFPPVGARSTALGGASAALCDMEAAADNVVGLAYVDRAGVGLSIRQNYMLNAMCYKSCFAAVPLSKVGAMGLTYTHFGTTSFNEQKASLAYAMLLGNKRQGKGVALGVRFDYLYMGTSDAHYTPQRAVTFAAGLQMRPADDWCVGFQVLNPAVVPLQGTDGVSASATFRLGTSYRITTGFLGTIEMEKDLFHQPILRAGMEYGWREMFFVRTGISTSPGCYSFGLGYAHHDYHIDLAAQVHPTLGMTPQLSMAYQF